MRRRAALRALAGVAGAVLLTAFASAQPRAMRLTIARLQYDGGGDWYANPSSLPNLLRAIRERTSLKVEQQEARVRLTDEKLWDFPVLHVTGHGNIRLSDVEVSRLREYLLRGGLPWRMLPPCFPPVSTVRHWFYLWRDNGLWLTINPPC